MVARLDINSIQQSSQEAGCYNSRYTFKRESMSVLDSNDSLRKNAQFAGSNIKVSINGNTPRKSMAPCSPDDYPVSRHTMSPKFGGSEKREVHSRSSVLIKKLRPSIIEEEERRSSNIESMRTAPSLNQLSDPNIAYQKNDNSQISNLKKSMVSSHSKHSPSNSFIQTNMEIQEITSLKNSKMTSSYHEAQNIELECFRRIMLLAFENKRLNYEKDQLANKNMVLSYKFKKLELVEQECQKYKRQISHLERISGIQGDGRSLENMNDQMRLLSVENERLIRENSRLLQGKSQAGKDEQSSEDSSQIINLEFRLDQEVSKVRTLTKENREHEILVRKLEDEISQLQNRDASLNKEITNLRLYIKDLDLPENKNTNFKEESFMRLESNLKDRDQQIQDLKRMAREVQTERVHKAKEDQQSKNQLEDECEQLIVKNKSLQQRQEDLVMELNQLKKQMRESENYWSLDKEEKEKEQRKVLIELQKLNNELMSQTEALKNKIVFLEQHTKSKEDTFEECQKTIKNYEEEIDMFKSTVQKRNESIKEKEQKLKKIAEDVKTLKENLATYKKNEDIYVHNHQIYKKKNGEYKIEIEELKAEVSSLKNDSSSLREVNKSHEAKLEEVQKQMDQLNDELSHSKQDYDALFSKIKNQKEQNLKLEGDLDLTTNKLQKSKNDESKIKKELQRLHCELEQVIKESEEQEEENSNLKKDIQKLSEELSMKKRDYSYLEEDAGKMKCEIKNMRVEHQNLERQRNQKSRVFDQLSDQLKDKIQDVDILENKLRSCTEDLISSKNLQMETKIDKEENERKMMVQIEELTICTEQLRIQLKNETKLAQEREEILEQQINEVSKTLKDSKKYNSKIKKRQIESDKLVEDLKTELCECQNRSNDDLNIIKKLQETRKKASKRIQELEEAMEQIEVQSKNKQLQFDKQSQELQNEINSLKDRMIELKEGLNKELSNILLLEETITQKNSQIEQQFSTVNELKVSLKQKDHQLCDFDKTCENLKSEISSFKEINNKLGVQHDELMSQNTELKTKVKVNNSRIEEMKELVSHLEIEKKRQAEQLEEEVDYEMQRMQDEIKGFQQIFEKVSQQKNEADNALLSKDKELLKLLDDNTHLKQDIKLSMQKQNQIELSSNKKMEEMRKEVELMQQEVAKANNRLDRGSKTMIRLEEDNQDVRSKLEEKMKMISELRNDVKIQRARFQEQVQQNIKTSSRLGTPQVQKTYDASVTANKQKKRSILFQTARRNNNVSPQNRSRSPQDTYTPKHESSIAYTCETEIEKEYQAEMERRKVKQRGSGMTVSLQKYESLSKKLRSMESQLEELRSTNSTLKAKISEFELSPCYQSSQNLGSLAVPTDPFGKSNNCSIQIEDLKAQNSFLKSENSRLNCNIQKLKTSSRSIITPSNTKSDREYRKGELTPNRHKMEEVLEENSRLTSKIRTKQSKIDEQSVTNDKLMIKLALCYAELDRKCHYK